MAPIEIVTTIAAPPGRCFDLARSIDLHLESAAATSEKVVAGRTSGLIEMGEEVTWPAKRFGLWQQFKQAAESAGEVKE